MKEKRGSQLLRLIDRYLGGLLLGGLCALLCVKRLFNDRQQGEPHVYLVVCIGAIGDLILLTEAVRSQLHGKRVFLACSNANVACAHMYQDVYAGIDVINIRSLLDVHRICKRRDIDLVFDSTQWANIGPVQVGVARLLSRDLVTFGFKTKSWLRNAAYSHVVSHSNVVHEVANFMNLLSAQETVAFGQVLDALLSAPYQKQPYRNTQKVLFHMWPSGARSYLKEWPEAYWIEVARYFESMGYKIFLSGSPADKSRNDAFISRAANSALVNIAGAYDLSELSAFIRNEIECAVSVNTGILHLVASLGVPLVGLHGPTNPLRWGPLGKNAISLLPESGNFAYLNYGFEYPKVDSEAYALDRLSVTQVISAVEQLKLRASQVD